MCKVIVVTSGKGRRRQDHLDRVARRGAGPDRHRSLRRRFRCRACAISIWLWAPSGGSSTTSSTSPQGDAKLTQALIRDKRVETLHLLAASQTRDKDALTHGGRRAGHRRVARQASTVCSATARPASSAAPCWRCASPTQAIVVTNPEVSSVRDSDRIIGLLDSKTLRPSTASAIDKHLLLTRFDPARSSRGEMLSDRRRARDPVHPAARHHSGERGNPSRLEHRRAGHDGRARQPRRRAPIWTRRGGSSAKPCRSRSPDEKKTFFNRLFGRRAA